MRLTITMLSFVLLCSGCQSAQQRRNKAQLELLASYEKPVEGEGLFETLSRISRNTARMNSSRAFDRRGSCSHVGHYSPSKWLYRTSFPRQRSTHRHSAHRGHGSHH